MDELNQNILTFMNLPHKGIQTLTPYQPGKSVDELKIQYGFDDFIKLASNENPLGASPLALQALSHITMDRLSYYPAPDYHPLMPKLAHKLNIDKGSLILSAGSDTLFALLMTAFALHQDKHILTHELAFMTYGIQANILGIPLHQTPISEDYTVNIDAFIHATNEKTGLIFIANPNNPTGKFIEESEICRLLDNIPKTTLLILDEAYFEFCHPKTQFNGLNLLSRYPNLVVTRTFSKAYGLAGLRLGYAIAHPEIIKILHQIQPPFIINQAALLAAFHALDDEAFLKETLHVVSDGIIQLEQGFKDLNLEYLHSFGNFLMVDFKTNAQPIFQALLSKGIIVRPLPIYQLPNHLRISVGKSEENRILLQALKEIRG